MTSVVRKIARQMLRSVEWLDPHMRTWARVGTRTRGYLRAAVYRGLYECARRAPAGDIIDIGPAQGGSTIALTLGRRHSGLPGTVYSIDPFAGSTALEDLHDRERNIAVITANVAALGAAERSVILPGTIDCLIDRIGSTQLAMMFIDADGALDRDFGYLYDRLVADAPIVLDDYRDTINHIACEQYLAWRSDEEMQKYLKSKGASDFMMLCPLGKEFTVFRFVNYFIERGFLADAKLLRYTLFARKPRAAPRFCDPPVAADLLEIRRKILERYYEERAARHAVA